MSSAASAVSSRVPVEQAGRFPGALLWAVRRELWENRSVYIAPLAAAVIFLFGFLVSLITIPDRVRGAMSLAAAERHAALLEPYMLAALLIMGTGVVVGIFYSLDALYAERRDRSILFWKSLPVSDVTTVVAKASIPLVVLPLITTAAAVAVQILMLLLSSVMLWMGGLGVTVLWQEVAPARLALTLLYHMVTVHALWYAPIVAWLLLASSWARRAPFLWAGIPLFAIAVVEKLAFDSERFVAMLQYRLVGGPETLAGSSDMPIDPLTHITPGVFLSSPGLWIGLALTAVFLGVAVRIRRHRGPA